MVDWNRAAGNVAWDAASLAATMHVQQYGVAPQLAQVR
jgi:hypothetical protein